MLSVQVYFCFQTERVYHCDIAKVASVREVISQSDVRSDAKWFVCVLIGSVGSWKRYDYSEAKKRGCKI